MPKRAASDDDGDSPRRKRDGSSKCNYCFREKPLVPSKNYCFDCIESGVECNLCHRPLRHDLVVDGICTACNRKRQMFRWDWEGMLLLSTYPYRIRPIL